METDLTGNDVLDAQKCWGISKTETMLILGISFSVWDKCVTKNKPIKNSSVKMLFFYFKKNPHKLPVPVSDTVAVDIKFQFERLFGDMWRKELIRTMKVNQTSTYKWFHKTNPLPMSQPVRKLSELTIEILKGVKTKKEAIEALKKLEY